MSNTWKAQGISGTCDDNHHSRCHDKAQDCGCNCHLIKRVKGGRAIDPYVRFWAIVKPPVGIGECWKWLRALNVGYGIFRFNQKKVKAHRFAYEQVFGAIPEGLHIDHLCRNRGCVNPYHMEPVTLAENIMRGEGACAQHARQTHCKNGHELTPDNLVVNQLVGRGGRICRTCANTYSSRYYKYRVLKRKGTKV